jgi:hypothetical protein
MYYADVCFQLLSVLMEWCQSRTVAAVSPRAALRIQSTLAACQTVRFAVAQATIRSCSKDNAETVVDASTTQEWPMRLTNSH